MPSKRIQIKVRLITRNLSLICQVIPIIFLTKRKINYYQKLKNTFVFGVALNSIGNSSKAIDVLENALEDHPYDRNLLFALATIQRDQGHFKKALNLAVQLVQNNPGISRYLQLKHQLELLVP